MPEYDFDQGVAMPIVATTSAADALKELMAFHHLTQADFAQHAAISQKQLSFILNRKAFMSPPVARQIEAATGVSARWLLELDFNYLYAQRENAPLEAAVQPYDWAKRE
ncbi:helix-turn-helix transcriptional regulator [Lacticaseibacillus kribbianus]|uniref:helix-turn-helix transcriptional regulator n=1 Tax=Lacticaseibacillus kribbianus TaxID=2926292 RepID=UPI001CD1F60D|nr:helix-turn-helix transcriptional regulator [Lacticaseibacillus kribbianus]